MGASWLIGALEALESETGWSPSDADVISGTSAGSVIGALTAAGIEPALMAAYSSGGARDEIAELEERGDRVAERHGRHAVPPPARAAAARARLVADGRLDAPAPAQPRAVGAHGRLAPARVRLDAADQRPRRRLHRDPWPAARGQYWAVAADYATGRRTVFGREGSPRRRRPRRRRRLLRDPRLLPPGEDRLEALHRRRDLLGVEPRPAVRRGPRPGRLPQPDVVARARDPAQRRPSASPPACARRPAAGSATRRRSSASAGPRS